jgi:hypothetical protein
VSVRALRSVPSPEPPRYDEARGRERMIALRGHLLAAALRYIREGTTRHRLDRLREASDLTGIPRATLEEAL